MKYLITATNQKTELEIRPGYASQNGEHIPYQVVHQSDEEVVLLLNNQIYRIQNLGHEEEGNNRKAIINGKTVSISIQSETELLIEKMGGANAGQAASKNIKAPMPGLIVKIIIAQGDVVEKGQPLLNFEAMKMENQLKSPGTGVVKNILVKPGDKVEKNQLLIEMV